DQHEQARTLPHDGGDATQPADDEGPLVGKGDRPRAEVLGTPHGVAGCAATCRAEGTGTCCRTVSTTARPPTSDIHSSGRIEIRWSSTGCATALTSSGTT